MSVLRKHGLRIAITLLPVLLALLHVAAVWRLPFLDRLDHLIYDARLRATMPRTLDPRIVIVDIDDPSLRQFGQWPWSRDKLARLADELMARQEAAVLGFDVLFIEPDASSGLASLNRLASGALRGVPAFSEALARLAPDLDHDALFAKSLRGRSVALGFYFTQTTLPRAVGQLPEPVLPSASQSGSRGYATTWNGFGGNIAPLANAARAAGFLNVLLDTDEDGVVRSVPLIARYEGSFARPGYYESLALAVYRLASGIPVSIAPAVVPAVGGGGATALEALVLSSQAGVLRVPVDTGANMLVPFRGPGGTRGGSFRYVPAADVLNGRLAPAELKGKIVLVGSTAPGLQDLRPTPVDAAMPGVEVHANIVSAMLDGRLLLAPDYAPGFEFTMVLATGLLLAIGLSILSVARGALLALICGAMVIALNLGLYVAAGLALPVATTLLAVGLAFALSSTWGYFVEARAGRDLAELFGTYVPPQLVEEMRADPLRYDMRAESKELTVMFCDMRGFTQLSEGMTPHELQSLLNAVFSRLTEIISMHRGTVDKYMGDCVMAFWGAPVASPHHAAQAVEAALDMAAAVHEINAVHRANGRPEISACIGLNTGIMSVGDMGSAVRRSYTVVGDAVNLASRLEGLGPYYGVEIVASAATRLAAIDFVWQELDLVRVKGKAAIVQIFTPLGRRNQATPALRHELEQWARVLYFYRVQEGSKGAEAVHRLIAVDGEKVLYQLYAQRLASMTLSPADPEWDGATRFDTK